MKGNSETLIAREAVKWLNRGRWLAPSGNTPKPPLSMNSKTIVAHKRGRIVQTSDKLNVISEKSSLTSDCVLDQFPASRLHNPHGHGIATAPSKVISYSGVTVPTGWSTFISKAIIIKGLQGNSTR